ncbi:MAG TPA: hypothetical protein VFJ99_07315, partial [Solirubrobacterales bacterium]|nr:hypothetical protein [Solirubrobacterales bacterium]
MTLMGAAPGGEPGEAWGYRQLPLSVDDVRVGPRELAFGPISSPTQPDPQLAFLRHTDANGWQVFETPVDESGNPYRGPIPNRLSARITHDGGGVLVGRDLRREVGEQVVVLVHDPGQNWHAIDAPPPEVLFPPEGEQPAETLAEDGGSGAVAVATVDESGGDTGLLFGPQGRNASDGIVHFDGAEWTREPVEVPAGSEKRFKVLAIAATGLGNAWALAKPDETLERSVVLLERTSTPQGWVERPLAGTPFADSETPGLGISDVEPIGGAAQPLTVTSEGVWIDLTATIEGIVRDVTLFFDSGDDAVTGSWCDADPGPCTGPLGAKLSRQGGYRSFAWPDGGLGTRVITNPLDPGGAENSNRGTYLRFTGGEFVRMPGGGGNFRPSGAFAGVDSGWLEGPVEISAKAAPVRLRPWPVSIRAPLADVAAAPGSSPGALGAGALAVGVDGSVVRYEP